MSLANELRAFDRAAEQLLDAEPAENLPWQIAKLRILFIDEVSNASTPPKE